MNQQKQSILYLEIVWWIITGIVVYFVMNPIWSVLGSFEYQWINIFFIVILITYTRHIFLLKYTFLAFSPTRFRIGMVFVSIPLVFFTIQMVFGFQTYLDNGGNGALFENLNASMSQTEKGNLLSYIHTEMSFFGIGSAIAALLLPLRMTLSVWRENKNGSI
jgi:hypothetical protein